jgi:hypothetical protein
MPDNNHQAIMNWKTEDEYLNTLSKKERYHVRHEILKYQDRFIVEFNQHANEQSINKWVELYQSVKKDSYKLNTFDLPANLFDKISSSKNWEVMSLKLTTVNGLEEVAVVFNYKSDNVYNAMFIGIDKNTDVPFSIYRQALYQILKRAKELNCVSVNYGFTASLEKRRIGALAVPTVAYMQSEDHFNASVIESMQVVKNQSVMV